MRRLAAVGGGASGPCLHALREASVAEPERAKPTLLDALGLPKLLALVHTAAPTVTAAGTYHPVASFLREGSGETRCVVTVPGH